LDARDFEELKIPFIAVATDLYSGEVVRIGGGPLIPAIQASSAVPFVFAPVQIHGRVLVDGGVADPVPSLTAKDLGAELVVAVDLGFLLPKTFPSNLFSVATRCAEISMLWQSETCANHADIVLRPECGNVGLFEDCHGDEVYEAGRRAARDAIPLIKHRLCLLGYLPADAEEGYPCKEEINTHE
jgi:NTE family protein